MKRISGRINSAVQEHMVRYSLILALSLLIVHLFSYNKLPFSANYRFPTIPFIIIASFGILLCTVNYVFSKRVKFKKIDSYRKRMFYEAVFHFSITTLFYSLLYVLVNRVIFEFDFIFVNYLKYLFISIVIVLFEYVLREALIKKKVEKENNGKLFVKTGTKILNVDFNDIALFHSRQGIVSILLKNSKTKWVTQFNSLKEIESILPPEHFFKVNRQYIVHRDAVRVVEKDSNRKLTVHLDSSLNNGHPSQIKISRYTSRDFKKWLNGIQRIA